jgi:hypothetical protein
MALRVTSINREEESMPRYRVTAVKPGRSATLTPRPGAADPAGITKLVLRGRTAGTGKFRVGKTLRVLLKPKSARAKAKAHAKRPRR